MIISDFGIIVKAMLNFNIEDNKATSYKQSMMDDIKPTDGADKKHQGLV